jgi:hypothetical protein
MSEEPSAGEVAADDCHKCQLCQMLSGSALLDQPGADTVAGSSVYSMRGFDHFYDYSPGQLQRPPSTRTPA